MESARKIIGFGREAKIALGRREHKSILPHSNIFLLGEDEDWDPQDDRDESDENGDEIGEDFPIAEAEAEEEEEGILEVENEGGIVRFPHLTFGFIKS